MDNQNGFDEPESKRSKPNQCIACLGLFQDDYMDIVAKEIIEKTDLNSYECNTIYTSITVPITVQIRELSLWILLFTKLPGKINESKSLFNSVR